MSKKAHGQLRRSQVITIWGPGALLDLPKYSAIIGGLETWPKTIDLEEIIEARLAHRLQVMTNVVNPKLYAPPSDSTDPRETKKGIGAWRFPEFFLVQEKSDQEGRERARRLVHRKALDPKGKFEGLQVVPTRFVRGCPRGHVDDLDWRQFLHAPGDTCHRQLWLDERGTSGDLADLVVGCDCGRRRGLNEALDIGSLGTCQGRMPWLGRDSREDCNLPSRLLIRTAANAYFPQVVSVLSLPDRGTDVQKVVLELWDDLQIVDELADLLFLKKKPKVAGKLESFGNDEVLEAVRIKKSGQEDDRPVKQV